MSLNKNSRQYAGGSPTPNGAESPSLVPTSQGGKKRQTPVNNPPSAGHTPVGVTNNSMGATPRGAFSGTTPRPNSRTGLTKGGAAATCESPSAAGGKPNLGTTPQRSMEHGSAALSGLMGSTGSGAFSPAMHSANNSHHVGGGGGCNPQQQTAQSTTPDTMMDEFDFMLTEENLQGGAGASGGAPPLGSMIGATGPVLTDFHCKLGMVADKMAKPTAKPLVSQQGGMMATLTQPGGAIRHGAINPVGESPNGQYMSNPNTPGLRPMSRAPAASVCNYCGSSLCGGQCAGARELSPLIVAALQSQRLVGSTTGSPALFTGLGNSRLISPTHGGERPRSTGENGRHSVGDERITPHLHNTTPRTGSKRYVDPISPSYVPVHVPTKATKQQSSGLSRLPPPSSTTTHGYGAPVVFSDTMSNKSAGNSKLQRPTVTKAPSESSATASSIHSCKTQPALATLASDLQDQGNDATNSGRQPTSAGVRRSQRRILRSQTGSAFSDTRSNMSVPSPTKQSRSISQSLSHPAIDAAKAAGKY